MDRAKRLDMDAQLSRRLLELKDEIVELQDAIHNLTAVILSDVS